MYNVQSTLEELVKKKTTTRAQDMTILPLKIAETSTKSQDSKYETTNNLPIDTWRITLPRMPSNAIRITESLRRKVECRAVLETDVRESSLRT
jgi:hypothetical protein